MPTNSLAMETDLSLSLSLSHVCQFSARHAVTSIFRRR